MKDAAFWNAALALTVGWREAYGTVELEAKALLAHRGTSLVSSLSTNELVEALYPSASAVGHEALVARARMFKALAGAAEHGLKGWWTSGEPEMIKRLGKTIRRKRWHAYQAPDCAPVAQNQPAVCPHCGGSL